MGDVLSFRVTSDGGPCPARVQIFAVAEDGGVRTVPEFTTSQKGFKRLQLPDGITPKFAIFLPLKPGAWRQVSTVAAGENRVDCPPCRHWEGRQWWHALVGADAAMSSGRSVRVGVVDAGFEPRGAVSHVRVIEPDGTTYTRRTAASLMAHGEQVCRILGARPSRSDPVPGIAPGAEIVCVDVRGPRGGASLQRVVDAVDWLVEQERVDLINLSLGTMEPEAAQGLAESVQGAFDAGVASVVAAGNSAASSTAFPARLAECIAVGSLAGSPEAPPDSFVAYEEDFVRDNRGDRQAAVPGYGRVFLSFNSNFGDGLNCVAPGSGLIIGPRDGQFDVTGTSFAAPVVTGLLACRLGADRQAGRGAARRDTAGMQDVLRRMCMRLDMAATYQGWGMACIRDGGADPSTEAANGG